MPVMPSKMLTAEKRGCVCAPQDCTVGKPFYDDNISESDTPSTHDDDDSEMSDLTEEFMEELKLWNSHVVRPEARMNPLHEQHMWAYETSASITPFQHAESATKALDRARIDTNFDLTTHADNTEARGHELEAGENRQRGDQHNKLDENPNRAIRASTPVRDSTTRRTMTTKNERRAAFDSLMGRRGTKSSSSWPRRHSSAPSSPVMPRVGDDCLLPDFQLLDGGLPARPSSAPVSPMFRSLRSPNDAPPPHMLLDALQSVEEPSPPVSTLVMEANPQPQRPRKVKASVSFGYVHVRSYEVILGDNPSCVSGPSLSLGWRYNISNKHVSVDDYEAEQTALRSKLVPLLSRRYREDFLLGIGYSQSEIASAVRESNRIRSRRRQTITNLYAARAEEVAEGTKRWVKRTLKLGDKKKPKSSTARITGKQRQQQSFEKSK